MKDFNYWNLLRSGKAKQDKGLQMIKALYLEEPDASHSMELGVALLWLEQYVKAWEHFRSRIDDYPRCGDNDYGMAGVAQWCLGKPDEAVSQWRLGLKAKYSRTSGLNIRILLLLYFASTKKPELIKIDQVKELMFKKLADIRIKNWPGPILQFLLGKINVEELDGYCKSLDSQNTVNRFWMSEFYKNLNKPDQSKHLSLRECMLKLSDTNKSELDEEPSFLGRIWNEEFFLARYESHAEI